jgi:hypothetical protein
MASERSSENAVICWGDSVVEDFEIGCVQAADGVAGRISNGESGLDQIGFSVQNRRTRSVGVSADSDFLQRGLGA